MENRFKANEFRNGSPFYSSNVGLFTTLAESQDEDIKQSRIKNLPSYQRCDLSNKLDFVVVFQTMEIERLSTEIEVLRVKLKASERQIRNYSNYEVQIKELTQNCFQLEEERVNYQNQVEKMSLACNELYQQLTDGKRQQEREVDDLKRQYGRRIDELTRNNQELAVGLKTVEEQIKKKIENERQSEAKNKTMLQDLGRLNQALFQNQKELQLYKQQQKQKGAEFAKNIEEMKKLQQSAQNQIAKRGDKLNAFEIQNRDLTSKLNELKNNMQGINQDLIRKKQELTVKEGQNKQLWSNLSAIYEAISAEKERSVQLGKYIQSLKSAIYAKSAQVEKVKDYLTQYHHDMETSAARQQELMAAVENYERVIEEINGMREEIFNMKNAISDKQDELAGKEQHITELTFENKQLFHKNKALEQNCLRISQALQQMQNSLQSERQAAEKQRRQKMAIQSHKQQLERELATVKADGLIKEDLKRQIQSLKENCKLQQNNIQGITNRFMNIQKAIKLLKDQLQKLREKEKGNQILRQQLNESVSLNEQLIESIGARNKQIDFLFQENQRITKQKMLESARSDVFETKSTSPARNMPITLSSPLDFKTFSPTKNIPSTLSSGFGQLSSSSRSSLDSNFGRDRFSQGNYVTQKQPYKNSFSSQLNIGAAKSRSTLGDIEGNKMASEYSNRDANGYRQTYLTNRDNRYGDFVKRQRRQ